MAGYIGIHRAVRSTDHGIEHTAVDRSSYAIGQKWVAAERFDALVRHPLGTGTRWDKCNGFELHIILRYMRLSRVRKEIFLSSE